MAHKKVNLPQKIRLLMDCYLTEEKKEKKLGRTGMIYQKMQII